MWLRLVHCYGEEKLVEAGKCGDKLQIFWPIAGWYTVYSSSGRIAGAKSWRVHPDDMQQYLATRPKRPRKQKIVLP